MLSRLSKKKQLERRYQGADGALGAQSAIAITYLFCAICLYFARLAW
jgi:hypothetical protein